MSEAQEKKRKRYLQGMALAVVLHLAAGAALGLTTWRTVVKEKQIVELTLAKAGAKPAAPQPAYVPPPPPPPPARSEDDVVDERLKPQEETPRPPEPPPPQPQPAPQAAPAPSNTEAPPAAGQPSEGSGNAESGEGTADQGSGSGEGDDEVAAERPYIIHSYKPAYPRRSRERHSEGTVYVRVLVNERGRVDSVSLDESSGDSLLDDAALEAVEDWRFSPAKNSKGKEIPCYVVIPVSFVLK